MKVVPISSAATKFPFNVKVYFHSGRIRLYKNVKEWEWHKDVILLYNKWLPKKPTDVRLLPIAIITRVHIEELNVFPFKPEEVLTGEEK